VTTNDTFHLLPPGVKPLTVSILPAQLHPFPAQLHPLPAQLHPDAGQFKSCAVMNGAEDIKPMKSYGSCVHLPCQKCNYTVGLAIQLLRLCTENPQYANVVTDKMTCKMVGYDQSASLC